MAEDPWAKFRQPPAGAGGSADADPWAKFRKPPGEAEAPKPLPTAERVGYNLLGAGKEALGQVIWAGNTVLRGLTPTSTAETFSQNPEKLKAAQEWLDKVKQAVTHPYDTAVNAAGEWMDKALPTPTTPQQAEEQGGAYLRGAENVAGARGLVGDVAATAARPIERALAPAAEKVAARGEAKAATANVAAQEKNDLIRETRKLGLRLSSQDVGAPIGKRVEAFAGRPQYERELSAHNAERAREVAAADVGIKEPLSHGSVARAIEQTLPAYKAPRGLGRVNLAADTKWQAELENIRDVTKQERIDVPEDFNPKLEQELEKWNKPSMDADTLVSKIRKLRERASSNFRGNADDVELARAQRKIATAMEEAIERHGEATGKAGIIKDFREARVRLAKLYTLRDALTESGHLDLKELESRLNKGEPLTGNLRTLARAKSAFDRSFQNPDNIRGHYIGVGDVALATLAGGGSGAKTGMLSGIGAGAVAGASRPLTRAVMASRPYQGTFIKPREARPGLVSRQARKIADAGKAAAPPQTIAPAAKPAAPPAGPTLASTPPSPKAANLAEMGLDTKLKGKAADIQSRFADQIAGDYKGSVQRYNQLEDAEGGKVLNTDTARELSSDYLQDRTQAAAVHEPSSWFIKRRFAEMLSEPPKPGETDSVLFMGGGAGAGKSSAIKNIPAVNQFKNDAQIVYDTNLANAKKSIQKIDQALAAGKTVRIAYVWRDPTESLTVGALPRAMGQEKKFGSGRTVPIGEHVNTHVHSNEAIRQVAEHYKGDSRVEVMIIDNSRGRGNAALITLDELPKIEYNSVAGVANEALEREYKAGKISESVYRGFRGGEKAEVPRMGGGAGPQHERPREGRDANQVGRPKLKVRLKSRGPTLRDVG